MAYEISIWLLPVLIAVTFHEAAHGFVAHLLGDDTAWSEELLSIRGSTSIPSARYCCRDAVVDALSVSVWLRQTGP